jgi:hypothetical protein
MSWSPSNRAPISARCSTRPVGPESRGWDKLRSRSIPTERQRGVGPHDQFRWFSAGWKVMSELPGVTAFDAASKSVTEEDVAAQIACGPDVQEHVEKLRAFADAGFTHVAIVQIGGDHQREFFRWSQEELLPALRAL